MATKDRTTLKDEFKNGNLATGERFADLIDSMKVVQLPVVDPQALGTSLSFIDSISQDADGKITVTKKRMSPTVGSFQFVANDATAEAAFTAVGAKYSGAISGVSPSADTLGVILLMNDDDTTPTKTMMITTEEVTPATNPATYQFVYVGDLQTALPSGMLTIADIVNDFTGGVDKVLSAEAGNKLFDALYAANDGTTVTPERLVGMYVNSSNVVKTTSFQYYNIAYFDARNEAWIARITANNVNNASYPVGCCFLVDDISEVVADLVVTPVKSGNPTGSTTFDVEINVPAGKVLCVGDMDYTTSRFYYYEVTYDIKFEEKGKVGDLDNLTTTDKTSVVGAVNELNELMYEDVYEEMTPTKLSERKIRTDNNLIQSEISAFFVSYFPKEEQSWKAKIKAVGIKASTACGAIVLVDEISDLDVGKVVNSNNILVANHTVDTANGWSRENVVTVPAGKILAVFAFQYTAAAGHFEYYKNTSKVSKIEKIEEENDDQGDEIAAIKEMVGNPDYVSAGNPLEIIKETAGYTSIFRKMGVIGGSMSSGEIYHTNGKSGIEQYGNGGSKDFYDCSSIQFMARLCGAEAFNFSSGGTGARSWINDNKIGGGTAIDEQTGERKSIFWHNPCQMYLIQLGNNDLGYHNEHSSYTLGNLSDVAGNNGVFADTFYGNMGAILQKIREVQPRAYVFLSTFLKGYGDGSNSDGRPGGSFDYNQAIRNIVEYYTENNGANRPVGDRLHYYLVDYYTYGKTLSYYNNSSGSYGSHLSAAGYLMWAYQYCTYIDWIIKNNFTDFFEVPFVGYWGVKYNLTNAIAPNTVKLVEVNGSYSQKLQGKQDPNHTYTINSVTVTMGGVDITNEAWDSSTGMVTIDEVTEDVVITATAVEE